MDSYTGFAPLYDLFMDNIPYEEWSSYLIDLLKENNIDEGIVLELGCGTGNITGYLSKAGYDMIGIDNSDEMLGIALEKKYDEELDILYLNQDMRDFELYGTVAAVVSICDSLNYITEYNDLVKVFKLVNNYLDPKGLFIFDLNTIYKYAEMGDCVIAENRTEGSFIWENSYFEDKHINQYDLTIFSKIEDNANDNLYEKFEETHVQRAYSLDEIKSALADSGLSFITAYDAFTHNPINEKSERIYVIAMENGK
ncbi:MAG: class I SAM-dependent methyltransferase [Lachnospiraceae bacterium]|nr:class I SAM-dependent methyltransferase [Lachnospiraceae bacterium]